MNPRINQLVKTLLQKDSLDDCSLQELKLFAERHPYFGAAQLLLTKKMQTDEPGQYDEQLQKTFLFFHNPLWVEQLLNEHGSAVFSLRPASDSEQPTVDSRQPAADSQQPAASSQEPTASSPQAETESMQTVVKEEEQN